MTDRPAGGWLELSVAADGEAVEAVSEILARVATGITVEPAFTLVDEGLGARLDPTRPATVRAYLAPGPAPARARALEASETALGHLQAINAHASPADRRLAFDLLPGGPLRGIARPRPFEREGSRFAAGEVD